MVSDKARDLIDSLVVEAYENAGIEVYNAEKKLVEYIAKLETNHNRESGIGIHYEIFRDGLLALWGIYTPEEARNEAKELRAQYKAAIIEIFKVSSNTMKTTIPFEATNGG